MTPLPPKPPLFIRDSATEGLLASGNFLKTMKGADNMARPNKEMMLRKETKEAILSALEQNGNTEKYLLDQVDQYMEYYDNLKEINARLKQGFKADLVKEKRLLTKEMRSILTFLKLKPGIDAGGDEPEAL